MLALCAALLAPASLAQTPSDALVYNGSINAAGAAIISQAIDAGAKTLRITSAGGDASLAIPLAFKIREHGVRVIAAQYCISACAEYLLPAGVESQVEANTILGFHNTVSSSELVASTINPAAAERIYGDLAREERRLYDLLKIDRAYLVVPVAQIGPLCSGFTRTAPDRVDAFLLTTFTILAPSPRRLASMGFRLTYLSQPPPLDQLAAVRGTRTGLERANWKIETDSSAGMSAEQAEAAIRAVTQCSPEMRQRVHIPPE